ncbi:MAG: dioxygenase family protein [Chloroflexota bacterium]
MTPRSVVPWWLVAVLSFVLLLSACTGTTAGGTAVAPSATSTLPAPPPQVTPSPAASVTAPAATVAPLPTSAAPSASPTTVARITAPACVAGTTPTPAQTEGPYYKANPPQRTSLLEEGMAGTRLTIAGQVLTADCQPVSGARVDFWQADANGQYDNTGFRLRGYQLTDAAGRYTVETVVPGEYPGRTGHIHVKVQAPNGPVLTTQLYLPDEPANASDSIFNARLVMAVGDTPAGKLATFDFVLPR